MTCSQAEDAGMKLVSPPNFFHYSMYQIQLKQKGKDWMFPEACIHQALGLHSFHAPAYVKKKNNLSWDFYWDFSKYLLFLGA